MIGISHEWWRLKLDATNVPLQTYLRLLWGPRKDPIRGNFTC